MLVHGSQPLRLGFRLTSLVLHGCIPLTLVAMLATASYSGMEKLNIALVPTDRLAGLALLGDVFKSMPNLADLCVRTFRDRENGEFMPDVPGPPEGMKRNSPVWQLPALTKLSFHANGLFFLPEMHAPKLKIAKFTSHKHSYSDVVSFILLCAELEEIDSQPSADKRVDRSARPDDRFAAALRANMWPSLRKLHVDTIPDIVDALIERSIHVDDIDFRQWREAKLSCAHVAALFKKHPRIQSFCWTVTEDHPDDRPAEPLPATSLPEHVGPTELCVARCTLTPEASDDLSQLTRNFVCPNMRDLVVKGGVLPSVDLLRQMCPNLKTLSLSKCCPMRYSLSQPWLSLRTLKVSLLPDDSGGSLIETLRALPKLEVLTVERISDWCYAAVEEKWLTPDWVQQLLVAARAGHLQQLTNLDLGRVILDEGIFTRVCKALPKLAVALCNGFAFCAQRHESTGEIGIVPQPLDTWRT